MNRMKTRSEADAQLARRTFREKLRQLATRPGKLLAVLGVMLALTAGGIAYSYASIPGSGGTINGCYQSNSGSLRVIDTEAGQTCLRGEAPLSWSQTGPPGAPGAPGATGPTEGVNAIPGAFQDSVPATLISETRFMSELESSFTTTVGGRLYLSKSFQANFVCSEGTEVWWWLILDGEPEPGTLTRTSHDTYIAQTLTGVTELPVSAGLHRLDVGARCVAGEETGAAWTRYSGGSVIVLGG